MEGLLMAYIANQLRLTVTNQTPVHVVADGSEGRGRMDLTIVLPDFVLNVELKLHPLSRVFQSQSEAQAFVDTYELATPPPSLETKTLALLDRPLGISLGSVHSHYVCVPHHKRGQPTTWWYHSVAEVMADARQQLSNYCKSVELRGYRSPDKSGILQSPLPAQPPAHISSACIAVFGIHVHYDILGCAEA